MPKNNEEGNQPPNFTDEHFLDLRRWLTEYLNLPDKLDGVQYCVTLPNSG